MVTLKSDRSHRLVNMPAHIVPQPPLTFPETLSGARSAYLSALLPRSPRIAP